MTGRKRVRAPWLTARWGGDTFQDERSYLGEHHQAVQDRDARQGDESDRRRNRERHAAKPERGDAAGQRQRHGAEDDEGVTRRAQRTEQEKIDQQKAAGHDDHQALTRDGEVLECPNIEARYSSGDARKRHSRAAL